MKPIHIANVLVLNLALFASARAQAASLQKVGDWGAKGVPATVSMYIYVPDELASSPPVLVLSHFCSGSASAVFGQAQTGGLIEAADRYGFIVVVPQTSNNCWDVGSTRSLTHDGGGDTQAVAQMVKYTVSKYQADAARVYATGDSSGGMMTQALLAVYPDVFKGGSAFAGVPAGCWSVGDPDGSWSNQCAGGTVTHTAQEWGDLVRAMDPSYSGHRPRVQLFHGDADKTISYANLGEGIKQWTNVLGLSTAPTSTDTVTLGTHQATRQRWQNSCGYVVLEAFTSQGGDHGPSDALFQASYVVPFLGLDQAGATDPELQKCAAAGSGGASGAGGATNLGGAPSAGGAEPGSAGLGTAGNLAAGGSLGGAGASTMAGSPANGGALSRGGNAAAGNPVSASGSGGSAGATETSPVASDSNGCSCAAAGNESSSSHLLVLALGAACLARKRRR